MVLSHWLQRGLGQVLAPDANYEDNQEQVDTQSSFWQLVAPDPQFDTSDEPSASSSNDGSRPVPLRVPPAAAFLSPGVAVPQVECVHCHQNTPTSATNNTNTTTPVGQSTPQGGSTLFTPDTTSRKRQVVQDDSEVNEGVVIAAKAHAEALVSPKAVKEKSRKFLRLCSSSKVLSTKSEARLRTALEKDPSLASVRAFDLGGSCENGYTPLMGAALNNNLIAAKILLEIGGSDLLRDVDLLGKTALHIAAEKGHVTTEATETDANAETMVEFLQRKTTEAFGQDAVPPVDLTGRTALGVALMSPLAKARKNRIKLEEVLFSPSDRSLFGSPAPAKLRVEAAPSLQTVYGFSDLPGRRVAMEDAMMVTVWDQEDLGRIQLFAVFDGHGDDGLVSDFVANHIPVMLEDAISKNKDGNWSSWLKATCLKVDGQLKASTLQGGSTAVIALVTVDTIVVANVGDSRCILVQTKDESTAALESKVKELSVSEESPLAQDKTADEPAPEGNASSFVVKPLSFDHKPSAEIEKERIYSAGLTVYEETFQENGEEVVIEKVELSSGERLAVCRAFGDFEYKANETLKDDEQAVVSVPDIQIHERDTARDSYLILACDGVWDVMSNEEVGEFVAERVASGMEQDEQQEGILPTVGDQLLEECLTTRKSGDNMSVIVVALSKAAEKVSGGKLLEGKTLDFA